MVRFNWATSNATGLGPADLNTIDQLLLWCAFTAQPCLSLFSLCSVSCASSEYHLLLRRVQVYKDLRGYLVLLTDLYINTFIVFSYYLLLYWRWWWWGRGGIYPSPPSLPTKKRASQSPPPPSLWISLNNKYNWLPVDQWDHQKEKRNALAHEGGSSTLSKHRFFFSSSSSSIANKKKMEK